MAAMAMMPLIARLVWLLTDRPSAEVLDYHSLLVAGKLTDLMKQLTGHR